MITKQRTAKTGFTLTELLVVIGVGSLLTGVLLADLTQARTKLLQQACATNMKQWGMAFNLYAQDYNKRLYYHTLGHYWDNTSSAGYDNVYLPYLGGDDSYASIRRMRICPARIGAADFTTTFSYAMPIGMYKKGVVYANADATDSPFFDVLSFSYFPSLAFLSQPSSFLLLIEANGHTLRCGGLVSATTTPSSGTGDQVPAIQRHGGGGVNCLFGDFRVEFVSSQVITNQDAVSCPTGNPWFMLN